MSPDLPTTPPVVTNVHRLLAMPIQAMNALNIGPFGGENSVSAVIEALLHYKRGEPIDFELSKTERFLFERFKDHNDIGELQEYRDLSVQAQEFVLEHRQENSLGVVWLGGGMITLEYPLIGKRKPDDIHVWTDAHPKVVGAAQSFFKEVTQHAAPHNLAYDITLPRDVDKLNRILNFLGNARVDQIVIMMYGVSYVMTIQENYEWMRQLELPPGIPVTMVFNSPQGGALPGKLIAAVHDERMYAYNLPHIHALYGAAFPAHEVVWHKARTDTQSGMWETWVIDLPAAD